MTVFSIQVTFQGKVSTLEDCTIQLTSAELYQKVQTIFGLAKETELKILFKGKRLSPDDDTHPIFPSVPNKKLPKLLVMATSQVVLQDLATKRSDPTIRGFDQEQVLMKKKATTPEYWGPGMVQDRNYKFCRFQACTWHSFGHRSTESTPHAFRAMELLEKLASDPGIVAIMKERELVVGTLGEMDPIDDRLMQKKQQQSPGSCLLGYNTNAGTRIDIKLRTDDLQDFRPYPELISTLIHELSHNWVGEHNLLFWTNYGQMRAEYLYTHAMLGSTVVVNGKTTTELAGLDKSKQLDHVLEFVLWELQKEMQQHGLNPAMIEAPIKQRCDELQQQWKQSQGQKLGGGQDASLPDASGNGGGSSSNNNNRPMTAREKALAAAERRAKEQKQNPDNQQR